MHNSGITSWLLLMQLDFLLCKSSWTYLMNLGYYNITFLKNLCIVRNISLYVTLCMSSHIYFSLYICFSISIFFHIYVFPCACSHQILSMFFFLFCIHLFYMHISSVSKKTFLFLFKYLLAAVFKKEVFFTIHFLLRH